ncbi:hypothetical protein HA402_006215 [Bradysia odoriphaga]|nr:hypothetical protein HA402_006215 [Bradysia odoriphaga]
MDIETTSVSKGCFLFKNGRPRINRKRKHSVLDIDESELWYRPYKIVNQLINGDVENIQKSTFIKVKEGLMQFVENSCDKWCLNNLPTAVVVTGVNQGDHYQFFDSLTKEIQEDASVAVIQGRNCLTLKSAINTMVFGLIGQQIAEDNDDTTNQCNLRRSQYNIQVLRSWYDEKFGNQKGPTLVIVIPDFELFRKDVLVEFIQLLLTMNDDLPMVLVLGVATDISILQRSLPSHVINKLQLCKFQSSPSKQCLEQILSDVILSPKVCVNLSGNVLNLLADIFLYFDFSIHSFLKGYQYCLMEHYFKGNAFSLCGTTYEQSIAMIRNLKHTDIEDIRQLPSFRIYVESRTKPAEIISLLEDDKYFVQQLPKLLKDLHEYFHNFHCFARLLFAMVKGLPKNFIGKQLRDVYALCSSTSIFQSETFTDLWQLLRMLSKEEFLSTLDSAVDTLNRYKETFCSNEGIITHDIIDAVVEKLSDCITTISKTDTTTETTTNITPIKLSKDYKEELKIKMMEQASKSKFSSEVRKQMDITLAYIKDQLTKYLVPFNKGPALHELFVFDDVRSVRQHIMGAPRAVIHNALQNPHIYLQCSCCTLDDPAQILPSLPDVSIAFKLHLESGQMINLFDWLQAFNIIHQVDPDQQSNEIEPEIQARFVRVVAEMQFLGYIKSSKRKTDHVARLTW